VRHVYRRLLKLTLEHLRLIEDHLGELDQQLAELFVAHHDAVLRLVSRRGVAAQTLTIVGSDQDDAIYRTEASTVGSRDAFDFVGRTISWRSVNVQCPGKRGLYAAYRTDVARAPTEIRGNSPKRWVWSPRTWRSAGDRWAYRAIRGPDPRT